MLQKILRIKESFSDCSCPEKIYQRLMEWGTKLQAFDETWKIEENLVAGCQSIMYLHVKSEHNLMYFSAASDALISSGLAALLIEVYSGEEAETVLTTPPTFIEELGIASSLSPGRANGLAGLYLHMRKQALKLLCASSV